MCCCYLAIIILYLVVEAGASEYLYHICENTTDTPNSIFQANLKKLHNTPASNYTPQNPGYSTYTAGNDSETMAYVVSFCQVDLTDKYCQDCVTNASQELAAKCPYEDLEVIWYDGCMIRYDSKPFYSSFSKEDEELAAKIQMYNTQNVTDEAQFQKVFSNTMTELTTKASEGKLSNNRVKGFAFESKNITSLQTLYALVQCIPDLPPADCDRCLRMAINLFKSHNNSQGCRALVGNCMARYEIYPFYRNITDPPSSFTKPKGIGRRKQKQWLSSNINICGSSEQGSPKAEEANVIETGTGDVKVYSLTPCSPVFS